MVLPQDGRLPLFWVVLRHLLQFHAAQSHRNQISKAVGAAVSPLAANQAAVGGNVQLQLSELMIKISRHRL